MIHFDRVTFTYPTSPAPVLRDISAHIAEGELALLVGATGER